MVPAEKSQPCALCGNTESVKIGVARFVAGERAGSHVVCRNVFTCTESQDAAAGVSS